MVMIKLNIDAGAIYCENCIYKNQKDIKLFICDIFKEALPIFEDEDEAKRCKACLKAGRE